MPRFSPIVNLLYDLQKKAAQARSAFLNGLLDVIVELVFCFPPLKNNSPCHYFLFKGYFHHICTRF